MIARILRALGDCSWLSSDAAIARMMTIAGVLTIAAAVASLMSPRFESNLNIAALSADSGFAYTAPFSWRVPVGYTIMGDRPGNTVSNLLLRENGRLLGPAHSLHSDIRVSGNGRYSHWRTLLWFSASDSTDPRSNGRTYSVSGTASLHPLVLYAVGLFDLMVLVATRRRLVSDARFRHMTADVLMLAALALAALVAAGVFGRVNENAGAAKDAALVVAVLLHAVLGCMIVVAQWAAGAGLARLALGAKRATLADVLMLGFVLSLPLAAIIAVTALSITWGPALAAAVWLLCCLPLRSWRPAAAELATVVRAAIGILPFAIGFGCWMGLHWHGPTETLVGSPSGDLVYYSTSIASFSKQLYPYLNLGYEYEPLNAYFNMLFPLLGTALTKALPLEPFLFIAASGAAFFALSSGLAIALYVQGTGLRQRGAYFALCSLTLALAILVATRYPYWAVETIPMVHAVPLIFAVVYWARKNDARAQLLAIALAMVGSALTKVVSVAVLAPFAAAIAVPQFFRTSRRLRCGAIVAVVVAAGYVATLLYQLGSFSFGIAPLGPVSVNLVLRHHYDFWTALPFALRDAAAALLAVVAFLLADWLVASTIAFGFLLFLAYPYLFQFDFVCAVIILGLIACAHPEQLWRHRVVTIGALLLALPAVLLTDPVGLSSGLAWLVCIGSIILIAVAGERALAWSGFGRAAAAAAVLLCLGLVAVGRGQLLLNSGGQSGVLGPELRQIWLVVRERTPPDALIFTDQTGREATLLGSWNTYAFIGTRQIFVSNLYMNPATRLDPQRARDVLGKNDAVLNGTLRPQQLALRGRYSGYFAVVSRARAVPAGWVEVFGNDKYVLYRMPADAS